MSPLQREDVAGAHAANDGEHGYQSLARVKDR